MEVVGLVRGPADTLPSPACPALSANTAAASCPTR